MSVQYRPHCAALIHSDWSGSRVSGGVCQGGVADLRETGTEAVRSTADPHVAVPGYWLQKGADSVCASVRRVARVKECGQLRSLLCEGTGRSKAVSVWNLLARVPKIWYGVNERKVE